MVERYLPCNNNRVLRLPISTELFAIAIKEASSLTIAPPKVLEILSYGIAWYPLGDIYSSLNNSERHKPEYYSELNNVLAVVVCQVTRRRVTGRWHNRTWLKSSAVFPGYFVYKGAGPPFARGIAFSPLLIFRIKYTLLLRASSNPLARLLQPTIVLLYNLSASRPSHSVQKDPDIVPSYLPLKEHHPVCPVHQFNCNDVTLFNYLQSSAFASCCYKN